MSLIMTTSMSTTAPSTATSSGSAASSALPTPSLMQSRPSMASDTDSTPTDEEAEADLALSWSGRWTLGHRILAVNVLTIALFMLTIVYLDAYRDRIVRERERQTRLEVG